MTFRVYTFGPYRYRICRRTPYSVEAWDVMVKRWMPVGAGISFKDARRLAAADAYRRGLNP